MIGAVMRCVADNVEDVIIPDCGHWITEEQPQATTDLVVDFLRRGVDSTVRGDRVAGLVDAQPW